MKVNRLVADMDGDDAKVSAISLMIAEATQELAEVLVMEKLGSNL